MKHISDREFSALIDGDLSAAELEAAETHCAACAACAQQKNPYLSLQHALRGLPQVKVDETLALARIRERIASAGKEAVPRAAQTPVLHTRKKSGIRWYPVAALASAALIALALVFSLTYRGEHADLLAGKTTLTQGPADTCVAEQETDDIIRGYQNMRQLYYF
jgi:anti-sigma factor RsiW